MREALPKHRWMDIDQRNLFLMALMGLRAYQSRASTLRNAATTPTRKVAADEEITLAILGALKLDAQVNVALGPLFEAQTTGEADLRDPAPSLRSLLR